MLLDVYTLEETDKGIRTHCAAKKEVAYDPKRMTSVLGGIAKRMFRSNGELQTVEFLYGEAVIPKFLKPGDGAWEFHRKGWEARRDQIWARERIEKEEKVKQ